MTFNQLRYFIEIYKTGSMHRAADRLHVSQSTISIAIQNLEKELQVSLFNRASHGLTLTTAGMALYIHATEILELMEKTKEDLKKYVVDKYQIRFGMPPVLSLTLWPELFPVFQQNFPDYSFSLSTETRSMLKDMLVSNILDVAVLPVSSGLPLPSGLHSKSLGMGDTRTVTMSIHHPLAREKSITWEELANCDLLGYENGTALQQILENRFAAIGRTLVFKQLCPQLSTLISLIRKNIGVSILNRRITREFKDLVSIPIIGIEPPELYLVWRKSSNGFHMPKNLAELIEQVFHDTK